MFEHGALQVEMVTNGPFQENCYLAVDRDSQEALLIDPGDEGPRILSIVRASGAKVTAIIATHAHLDHVGAVAELKRALGVPFVIHADEVEWIQRLPMQAAAFRLPPVEVPEIDRHLADGTREACGGLQAEIIVTPGHSPAGSCLYFAAQDVIFVGDTLFNGSIGRTDLPGGDLHTLLRSIAQRLLVLPDNTAVYSGHGPPTTIGAERADNPFVQPDFDPRSFG